MASIEESNETCEYVDVEKRIKKTGPVDILNNFKISNSASISATGIIEQENEDCLRQIFGK